ncbi:XDD4 family exosortase-dependent surface protein [Argonema galeatum]|uniref:XDD4 family exosortase-dependent surface protein n=1 Tax=Argonema galeatum TaxID=2942762 RepID=UPI00201246BF|nr:XDD4 family exosortase-dependent surface protein [Argonema galeatum]MCL1467976.1 PEP-CTERM sorting domain-containing protein [Argonema galeatum A003/A1]
MLNSKLTISALKHLTLGVSALALVAAGQISRADAASIQFTGTGTNPASGGASNALGASVLFDDLLNPGKLTITLTNTGPGASVPSDVLTSVFWDYNGTAFSGLSLDSATAPTVVGGTPGTNVNLKALDEWKLPNTGNGTTNLPGITQNYGLGTAGLGIFQGGGGQQFNYAIISGYDNPNPAVSGGTFVKNAATFVLSGLPSGFDISKLGNVRFQYGTNLSEPSFVASSMNYTGNPTPPPPPPTGGGGGGPTKIPEPSTVMGLLLAGAAGIRLTKKQLNSVKA